MSEQYQNEQKETDINNNCMLLIYILNIIFAFTFWGLCIVIYLYNKSQQDALFLKFILVKNSTCFGQTYCPS
jgi:hypothetical protein